MLPNNTYKYAKRTVPAVRGSDPSSLADSIANHDDRAGRCGQDRTAAHISDQIPLPSLEGAAADHVGGSDG